MRAGLALVLKVGLVLAGAAVLGISALGLANCGRLRSAGFDRAAQELLARSERLREQAGPGYQEQALGASSPSPANGPFHRLDDRWEEARAIQEPPAPELAEGGIVEAFEFDADPPGLAPTGEDTRVRVADGLLELERVGTAHLASARRLAVPRDGVGKLVIRMRSERGKYMRLGWSAEARPELPFANKLDTPILSDGEFHTYEINAANVLKRGLGAGEAIRGIFLLASDVPDDRVAIDFVRFLSRRAGYARAPRGLTYQALAAEMRRALYMLPDQELEYTLTVPESAPTLELGCGLLLPDEPVEFRVAVAEADGDGDAATLYRETHREAAWHDARLDLRPWAGRRVRLRLAVRGSPRNVAFWSSPLVSSDPVERLNVIVLLEDTLRADHLSTYGYGRETSPFKTRLMTEDGVLFHHAFSQATKTRPSVPSLMTSLLPTATGVWHFADTLDDAYLTLAEILRHHGFRTASFIQNGNAGPYAGLHQGFDVLFDEDTVGTRTEGVLGERALRWIERNRHRNFFLYLHVADPHGVYAPPEGFAGCYRDASGNEPVQEFDEALDPAWVERPTRSGRTCLYDAEIRNNDAVLERFVQQLRERGLYRDTLLLMTSDHGEYLGEHGLWRHQPPGHRQVHHVPLMMVFPRRWEGGQEHPELVQLLDVMPTILDVAGVDREPLLLQGDSLVGLLDGDGGRDWTRRIVVSEVPMAMSKRDPGRNRGTHIQGSLLFRDWHFLSAVHFWPWRVPAVLKMKAFDFRANPAEDDPLLAFAADPYLRYRFARVLGQLQADNIEAWRRWTAGNDGDTVEFDPDVLDRLKALGYAP